MVHMSEDAATRVATVLHNLSKRAHLAHARGGTNAS